jgi:hypothetical protein
VTLGVVAIATYILIKAHGPFMESSFVVDQSDAFTRQDPVQPSVPGEGSSDQITPIEIEPVSEGQTLVAEEESSPDPSFRKEEIPVLVTSVGTRSIEPEPLIEYVHKTRQGFGFSLGDTLTGLDSEELGNRLNDMVSLGATWIRIDFDWSWIQADKTRPIDWYKIDRVVKAAHARGLKILPILVYTPPWARPDDCLSSPRCPPADPNAYAAFATEAVRRYATQGITHWEIWNEPNMRGSWLPAADPVAYRHLLEAAHRAIKTVDPTATIITGGLGPIATEGGNIAPVMYLDALYNAGASTYFDAIGFHPYSFPVLPSYQKDWNAWQQMTDTKISLRSIMEENGDSDKEIWITEYGAPTGGPGIAAERDHDYANVKATHVTETFQTLILQDALTEIQSYSWAGPLFWYSYQDLGTSSSTIENFFGIRHVNGTAKPAYHALKTALD